MNPPFTVCALFDLQAQDEMEGSSLVLLVQRKKTGKRASSQYQSGQKPASNLREAPTNADLPTGKHEITKLLLPVDKSAFPPEADTDNCERVGGEARPVTVKGPAAKLDPVCCNHATLNFAGV